MWKALWLLRWSRIVIWAVCTHTARRQNARLPDPTLPSQSPRHDQHETSGLTIGQHIWAIEVRSGLPRKTSGLTAFKKAYPKAKSFLIGSHGVPLEEFFLKPALSWFL